MTDIRNSPSGVQIEAGGGAVESVFGRDGDVVSDGGDYQTSLIDNASSLPGATLNDALASVAGSSDRANESTVPGASISDALDYLLANMVFPARGRIYDTFSGGDTELVTALINDMRFGDRRWNARSTTGVDGFAIEKIADESDAIGILRLNGPTEAGATPNGVLITQGPFGSVENPAGIMVWSDLSRVDFRARVESTGAYRSTSFGMHDDDSVTTHNAENSAVFLGVTSIEGVPGNWIAFTTSGFLESEITDTGVLQDDEWHDFRIERVSATEVRFYIDSLLVATHTEFVPAALSPASPYFSAGLISSGGGPIAISAYSDIDTFELTPV